MRPSLWFSKESHRGGRGERGKWRADGWGGWKRLDQLRPTQPPALSGTGNEYQPKCGDALRLVSKCRYGSFHLWINVLVAGKTV